MKVNDAISGAGLIVLAGLVYWLTWDFPGMHGQPYGPALFPRLIAVLMARMRRRKRVAPEVKPLVRVMEDSPRLADDSDVERLGADL